jgi:acetate kinase
MANGVSLDTTMGFTAVDGAWSWGRVAARSIPA